MKRQPKPRTLPDEEFEEDCTGAHTVYKGHGIEVVISGIGNWVSMTLDNEFATLFTIDDDRHIHISKHKLD